MAVQRERNLTLEWVKLIAAFFVVCAHIHFPGALGPILDCIARFTVPFFFAISGYYAYGARSRTIARKFFRTLRLVFWGNALYFLWDYCIIYVENHTSLMEYLRSTITLRKILLFLFTGDPPFGGFHLWFLSALVLCYAVLYIFVAYLTKDAKHYRILYGVSTFLLVVFICADSLMDMQNTVEINLKLYRNGIFMGLPFFSLGLFLHEHQHRLLTIFGRSPIRSILLMALGFLLAPIQYIFIGKAELPLGMLLVVPELFLFCLRYPALMGRESRLGRWTPLAGKVSFWVYILHIFVRQIIEFLQARIPVAKWMCSNVWPVPLAIWVFFLTLFIALVMIQLSSVPGILLRRKSRFVD